jgi:hypothetical protein
MRSVSRLNIVTLIVGMLAGALLFGGVSIAADTIGSADIKDGAVKKRDLSNGVKRSIDKKATDKEFAALAARVKALEDAKEAVDNGTGNANFAGGPGTTVTPTSATMTLAAGDADGISVESPNLNVAVQAGDVISFKYVLSNGAQCAAGSPRMFVEIGGAFPNSWDQNIGAGTQCGTGGVVTFTAPSNGRIGQAGFVYDNSIPGTVTFSELKIDGKTIPLA